MQNTIRLFIKSFYRIFFIMGLSSQVAFAKDLISISAVGDVMMGTTFPANALPENNGKNLFQPALTWLKASDIRFANFEGTFYSGPAQIDGKAGGPNRYLFQTPPSMVSVLQDATINVVSLSNNHVKDFGSAGIISTKNTLKSAGIQYSSKAGEVALFQVDNTEIALIAADFYKPPRSITYPTDTYEEIRNLKAQNKLVIVSAHAGGEGTGAEVIPRGSEIFLGENRGDSILFARSAIGAGADLVIMHGPHVPRGLEVYNDRLIAYSLGNFITGQGISISGNSKLAPLLRVQITKTGQFHSGQIVSFIQQRNPQRIELDKNAEALQLMKKVSQQQFPDSPLYFEENGMLKINN